MTDPSRQRGVGPCATPRSRWVARATLNAREGRDPETCVSAGSYCGRRPICEPRSGDSRETALTQFRVVFFFGETGFKVLTTTSATVDCKVTVKGKGGPTRKARSPRDAADTSWTSRRPDTGQPQSLSTQFVISPREQVRDSRGTGSGKPGPSAFPLTGRGTDGGSPRGPRENRGERVGRYVTSQQRRPLKVDTLVSFLRPVSSSPSTVR